MIDIVTRLVNDGLGINGALSAAAEDANLAAEREATARRTAQEAKQAYQDAEAEFVAETMFGIDGRNSETRKAQLDAALVAARRAGQLTSAWARMNGAQVEADAAKLALEQMVRRYRAAEYVAELQSAMLRAVAR